MNCCVKPVFDPRNSEHVALLLENLFDSATTFDCHCPDETVQRARELLMQLFYEMEDMELLAQGFTDKNTYEIWGTRSEIAAKLKLFIYLFDLRVDEQERLAAQNERYFEKWAKSSAVAAIRDDILAKIKNFLSDGGTLDQVADKWHLRDRLRFIAKACNF